MSKGPHITEEVEKMLTGIYLANPGGGAAEIRGELLNGMKETGLDLIFGPDWPSLSTVSVHLKKIRKKYSAMSPESKYLDRPWSMGTLVKYPILQECLPAVLRAFYAERRTDVKTDEYFRIGYESGHQTYLTVREALWIARLSPLFKYPTLGVSPSPEKDIAQYAKFNLVTAHLVYWAHRYALEEQRAEILDKLPLDTAELDIAFYDYAREEIYRTLVSVPNLIRYSWEATRNQLKKEA